jgi:hypothetical protein
MSESEDHLYRSVIAWIFPRGWDYCRGQRPVYKLLSACKASPLGYGRNNWRTSYQKREYQRALHGTNRIYEVAMLSRGNIGRGLGVTLVFSARSLCAKIINVSHETLFLDYLPQCTVATIWASYMKTDVGKGTLPSFLHTSRLSGSRSGTSVCFGPIDAFFAFSFLHSLCSTSLYSEHIEILFALTNPYPTINPLRFIVPFCLPPLQEKRLSSSHHTVHFIMIHTLPVDLG